jgi:hypothetical protein
MARRFRVLAPLAAVCCALLAVLAPAGAQPSARRVSVVVSPAGGDFALTQLSFPRAHGRGLTPRSLRLQPRTWDADDAIAMATPAHPRGRARVALLLIANRVTNLAEPLSVRLRALAAADLGPLRVRSLQNPIERRQPPPAWLCGLASHGRAPRLRPLGAHGRPIPGLGAAGAVSQAFEIACGLPAGTQLKAALAPPVPVPAPKPSPPAPEHPECAPCDPRPGFACPLAAKPAYCIARRERTAPATAGGAH